MTSTESENRPRKVLQEIVADQSDNVICENSEGEKLNLSEKRTLLAKNSLTKVKKGAVLFESRKVKAKLNDKRSHYNHDTKVVARMVTELLVLDKGSGEAVAVALTLNMEEKSLTLNCFGEDRGALLLKIFLEPFLAQLEGGEVRGEGRSGEESWRVPANGRNNDTWRPSANANADGRHHTNVNTNANGRSNDSWRVSGKEGESRRRPEGLSNGGGEGKVMEQRMAKLALAEISQQKLRDADTAGGRGQQSSKKVESEEKVRLRAERKRKEEAKKKKEEEARMHEEAEQKKLEREKESESEVLEERERLVGSLCQELLALSPEDGVRLLISKREAEDGSSRQDLARELLKALATLALEEREEVVKVEEAAVKGETRRVSFEEKNVEIGDQEGVSLGDSNNERKLPGGGILKCQKTSVCKTDVEKEAVKRLQNF